MSKKRNRLSINIKVAMAAVVAISVLTMVIVLFGYRLFETNVMDSYGKYATTVLEYAYRVTEDYSFGDMIKKREMLDGYEEMRKGLNRVKDCSKIEYLYAVYFEDVENIHSLTYAINAKSQKEIENGGKFTYLGTPCETEGFETDSLTFFQKAVKSGQKESGLLVGYSEEYGHMLNGYKVIFDSEGKPAGLLCVEIDINDIKSELDLYVHTITLIAAVVTIVVIAVYVAFAERNVVKPLMMISESTDAFVQKMKANSEPENLTYDEVNIKTNDEIGELADNIKSMAKNVKDYMINIRTVTTEKERLGAELDVATKIQEGILPSIFPPYPHRTEFELYASMSPARAVGGDLYDFFFVDDDHIALIIGDVTGKGIPAALYMVIAKTLIKNRTIMNWSSTSSILFDVNNQLCEGNDMEMFVTVWLAVIDLKTGQGVVSNCGHEHPAIMDDGSSFHIKKYRHSPALGISSGLKFEEHKIELKPGDSIFVYTDGVPEATNAKKEFWGIERMTEALNKAADKDAGEMVQAVSDELEKFVAGSERFDDFTMLCFKYKGGNNKE
ncbi:MAG: SpoIIE family protein phosphatase [Clostridiales bacterium]|nr:SpoIIE family protein phosphatase [Clostridiales bacterium]